MPDMLIGGEDGALSWGEDFLRVHAFMAHPRSEELRHQFLARMHERVAAEMEPELEAQAPVEAPPGFVGAVVGMQLGQWLRELGGFQRLAGAPSAQDVSERFFGNVWPGSLAGDILIYLHQMSLSGIKPSINKAIAITVDFLVGATTAAGSHGKGGSERYLREQWAEFKPVAHLWAAFRATFFTNREGGNLPGPTEESGLPFFLAFAEWFAEVGLSIYPHGRKQPILDNSELWRVPASVKARWPPIQFESEPLPDWALEVLSRYRPKKSD